MRRILGWMIVLVFAAAPVSGQTTRPAGKAKFLPFFGPEHTTLVHVPDLMPHLRLVLTHPRITALMERGVLGRDAQQNPHSLVTQLEKIEIYFPDDITLGFTDDGSRLLGGATRTYLLSSLCIAAAEQEERKTLHELQGQLLTAMRGLKADGLRIYIGFRKPGTPQLLFGMMTPTIMETMQNLGYEVKASPRSIRVSGFLLNMLSDAEERIAFLEEMGVILGKNDPDAAAMADELAKLHVDVELRNTGDGLLLILGSSREAGRAITLADLGDAFTPDEGLIASARWNSVVLKTEIEQALALWDKWKDTVIGQAVVDMDDEGLLQDLSFFGKSLEEMAPTGDFRLYRDTDLHSLMREYGAPAATPLAQLAVTELVPAAVNAYEVNGTQSLGYAWAAILSRFEERLENQRLKGQFGEDEARAERMEAFAEFYYTRMKEFRRMVFDESEQWFAPGYGWVLTTDGKVGDFQLRATIAGEPTTFRGNDLPMLEMAFMGVPRDGRQPGEFVTGVYEAMVKGIAEAADMELPDGWTGGKAGDLGLGRPTVVYAGDWVERAFGEEARVQLTITGDWALHSFELDGVFVLSTSPRLSKMLIEAKTNPAARMELPQGIVSRGYFSGKTIAGFFTGITPWLDVMDRAFVEKGLRPGMWNTMNEFLGTVAELTLLIDHVQWNAVQESGNRNTQMDVIVAK